MASQSNRVSPETPLCLLKEGSFTEEAQLSTKEEDSMEIIIKNQSLVDLQELEDEVNINTTKEEPRISLKSVMALADSRSQADRSKDRNRFDSMILLLVSFISFASLVLTLLMLFGTVGSKCTCPRSPGKTRFNLCFMSQGYCSLIHKLGGNYLPACSVFPGDIEHLGLQAEFRDTRAPQEFQPQFSARSSFSGE